MLRTLSRRDLIVSYVLGAVLVFIAAFYAHRAGVLIGPAIVVNPLLAQLRSRRDELQRSQDDLSARVAADVDRETNLARDMTEAEAATFTDLETQIRDVQARIEVLAESELRAAAAATLDRRLDATAGDAGADQTRDDGSPRFGTLARVTSEPAVYSPQSDACFVRDAYRAQFLHDTVAGERLTRHQRQAMDMLRDVGTSAFTGLVVPQYLVDDFANMARAGRPFANAIGRRPLPARGMTFSTGRLTTGTAVASQAGENAALQETNADDTLLTINVETIGGQQDVSRQAVERGEGVTDEIFYDLGGAYAVELNREVIAGAGHGSNELPGMSGTSGINAVTYTDASPTVAEFWPKLQDAIQRINSNRYMPANLIAMHPRRWGWLNAAVDTAGRPLVLPIGSAPQNPIGLGDAAAYGQVVGTISGIPVVTDASIPTNLGAGTNEDMVFVTRTFDHRLYEEGDGLPRQFRFEQTAGGNLTIKLVVFGYVAYTAGRYPTAISTIGGTGLVTPTF